MLGQQCVCQEKANVLLTYFAASCYFLIDVRGMPPESLPERNPVSLMIGMERAGDSGELLAAMRLDEEWLSGEDPGLWRDFVTLATGVLAPLEFPEMDVGQLHTLREGIEMINEGVVRELEESRQSGLAEGRSEGLAVGRSEGLAEGLATGHTRGLAEGQRSLLRRQIVWKFGDATAERCADDISGLTNNGRMEGLGRLILDCRTGEEFLRRLRGRRTGNLIAPRKTCPGLGLSRSSAICGQFTVVTSFGGGHLRIPGA